MFGGGKKKSSTTKVQTLIGQNSTFTGNLVFDGGLHVDGKIIGNVSADQNSGAVAVVSENGCIEGDVQVPNLLLNGKVIGDVYVSERVELLKHAQVTGNVYYNLLEMAMGAAINGNLVHRKPDEHQMLLEQSKESKNSTSKALQKPSSGDPAAAKS
jgi:cytoskeletal protein CcmA (bactofilin family)